MTSDQTSETTTSVYVMMTCCYKCLFHSLLADQQQIDLLLQAVSSFTASEWDSLHKTVKKYVHVWEELTSTGIYKHNVTCTLLCKSSPEYCSIHFSFTFAMRFWLNVQIPANGSTPECTILMQQACSLAALQRMSKSGIPHFHAKRLNC